MNKRFRYGLFGVGRIGRVHGQILLGQGQQIVAVGDENADAIVQATAALGVTSLPTFQTSHAMAELGTGGLDAVVISSHTKDHARDAAPFVAAGIPVYLEKPLTAELAEAFAFVEEIGTSTRVLQIGLQRRYDEALSYAKMLLDEKLIGDLREIRCVLRDQHPPPPTYTSRGLIIDMGIHVADEAIWLTGEFPNEVWARVFNAKAYQSPIDEGGNTAHVGFLTPSGVVGRLDLSRTHASGYNNETYVIGTTGTLHVGRFAGYPGPIPVEVWTQNGTLHAASRTFDMTRPPAGYAEFQPRFHRAYERAHVAFREAVAAGRPFAVTQNEVLDAQVFVEAAHRSAQRGGQPIDLQRPATLAAFHEWCTGQGLA
jgi:myo-inositol 2-dehydrogenase/D-chiro-inositol 1-dehydrogenase